VTTSQRIRIGVDLGGTKIEVIAIDDERTTLLRRRVPTPAGDYRGTVDAIGTLVDGVERELQRRGTVGVGTPGSTSPATGKIKNANSTVLIGKPLNADVAARLGREIRMTNDANCFAHSEAVDGAGTGEAVVFGVILGTGVGGGIAIDTQPLEGKNAIAGEWGHNPLPWMREDEMPGPRCYCEKYGCIETFLSGPAFARAFRERSGESLDAREIAERAAQGDRYALAALERYADQLARGLATVINIVDPGVVVLGGGVSNIQRLYETVPALLAQYVFSDRVDTRVVRAVHGDSSGVRGAAMLWD
jgi:fructokinase